MLIKQNFIFALSILLLLTKSVVAGEIYKCNLNGTVSYQNNPCPSKETGQNITAQQLNTERQKNPNISEEGRKSAGSQTPFKCDGRVYCSQMRSCEEASYFLANCPGVKMDGDRNGIPCEIQWCKRLGIRGVD